MSLDPRRPVSELPIAQRQLVAICRAIGSDARLIIMDEPTASLTKVEVAALLGLARQLSQKEITILFVSHKLNEVLDVAERVTILRDGRKIGVFEAREMTDRRLATLMTGRSSTTRPRASRQRTRRLSLAFAASPDAASSLTFRSMSTRAKSWA